jgi:hypothetical protein
MGEVSLVRKGMHGQGVCGQQQSGHRGLAGGRGTAGICVAAARTVEQGIGEKGRWSLAGGLAWHGHGSDQNRLMGPTHGKGKKDLINPK